MEKIKRALKPSFALSIFLWVFITFTLTITLCYCSSQETEKAIDDNSNRTKAVEELRELQGMLLEVEHLSYKNIPQKVLLDELESITSTKDFKNPYLKDFTFDIPNTSDIGELCEELISQIDSQVHVIEYGTKGD